MPLAKPYPPSEIDFEDWNDLADNYAGKATTVIVDASGKGDYTSVQQAVDALPHVNAGEILVRAGEYLLSKAIRIEGREDLVIRGVGKATRLRIANKIQESMTIDAASGQKNVIVSNGSSFQVGQHVCVRDDLAYEVNVVEAINGDTLTMEIALANTYTVLSGGRVYTCHSAIYVTGSSKRIRITNLLVDGNRLNQEFGRIGYYPSEHQGDGIRVSSTCEGALIDHCWVKSAAAHGICLGGKGHRILGNECWDNEYDGINTEPSCDEVLIQGNHSHDQISWNGIQIGYGTNPCGAIAVVGNICSDNNQGIAAQGGSRCLIHGNILKNNRFDGIEVYSMDRCVVSGNLITGADDVSDMTNAGIHVEAASSVGVISGNLVELCSGYGIFVEEGAYMSVTGNTVRKVGKHGIRVGSSDNDNGRDCVVSGNCVMAADYADTETYSGIAILGDRCVVEGNRLDDCDKYGIHITATADRALVLGNHVYQYTGTCLQALLNEGTNAQVDHNLTA